MPKTVLTDVRCFAVGLDLTSHSNKLELTSEVEAKPTTNYGSQGWTEVVGGLASAQISGEGQWEAGDATKVDDASWSQLGGVGPWSVSANNTAAVGGLAYFTRAMRADYTLLAEVGEVAPWTSTAKSSWPLVRARSVIRPARRVEKRVVPSPPPRARRLAVSSGGSSSRTPAPMELGSAGRGWSAGSSRTGTPPSDSFHQESCRASASPERACRCHTA